MKLKMYHVASTTMNTGKEALIVADNKSGAALSGAKQLELSLEEIQVKKVRIKSKDVKRFAYQIYQGTGELV